MNPIERLHSELTRRFPSLVFKLDAPAAADAPWFLDAPPAVVEWRSERGFGVSATDADDYGGGPEEVYNFDDALSCVTQMIITARPGSGVAPARPESPADPEVCFFDPHPPGVTGCATPLPEGVRLVVQAMDGTRGTVEAGLGLIRAVVAGRGELFVWRGSIGYTIRYPPGPRHGQVDCWRLISFRAPGENQPKS